jgi:hypothetical protein
LIDKLRSYARVDVPKWLASTQLAASSSTACFRFADKASSGSLEAEQDEASSVSRIARLVTLHFSRCHCHYQRATSEANVRFGSLAVIREPIRDVRFTP